MSIEKFRIPEYKESNWSEHLIRGVSLLAPGAREFLINDQRLLIADQL